MATSSKKNQPAADADEGSNGTENGGYVYPKYDAWEVTVEHLPKAKPTDSKRVKFTAYKFQKTVKIEHEVAEGLNKQSHNSRLRYYETGSVTNGDEETVTIEE